MLKQRVWLLDIITLLIFDNQPTTKFSQKRNYRNTTFMYLPNLTLFNWVFWLKHSQFKPIFVWDVVGYTNNVNVFFHTQKVHTHSTLTLTNLSCLQPTSNIVIISGVEEVQNAVGSVNPGASFYEREVSEMFNIKYVGLRDSRNLLLDYNLESAPLVKENSVSGSYELHFSKFNEFLEYSTPTYFSI